MKKHRIQILALLMFVVMTLSACGDAMYELTDEEEELIVQYAAYMVSKHNVYQKDGRIEIGSLLEDEVSTEETVEDEIEEDETETQSVDSGKNQSSGQNASENVEPVAGEISLAEAIGYKDQVDVKYKEFQVTDNYQEGKIFSLNSKSGYQFVVVKFQVKNVSGAKLDMNVLRNGPSFRASFDGAASVTEDVTLLLKDLSTFEGTLDADQSEEMVLLFEIPNDKAESISNISLSVKLADETKTVKL